MPHCTQHPTVVFGPSSLTPRLLVSPDCMSRKWCCACPVLLRQSASLQPKRMDLQPRNAHLLRNVIGGEVSFGEQKMCSQFYKQPLPPLTCVMLLPPQTSASLSRVRNASPSPLTVDVDGHVRGPLRAGRGMDCHQRRMCSPRTPGLTIVSDASGRGRGSRSTASGRPRVRGER